MNSSEIETAVSAILATAGVSYSVALVGETKRDDWKCDEWRVTLKSPRADYTFPFYAGMGHRVDTPASREAKKNAGVNRKSIAWGSAEKLMKPVPPTAAGVLHSVMLDGEAIGMSFIDWCGDFGYSEDSRKALATYEACCECGRKLRNLFDSATRQKLAEVLEGY